MDWKTAFQEAAEAAQARDWRRSQESSAKVAVYPVPQVCAVARLNILICQYHLGHFSLIAERALPLIQHLPPSATLTCVGIALLAANRTDSLLAFKKVALALAAPKYKAFDLPTVPIFVDLHDDLTTCKVRESTDAALMCEVVDKLLHSDGLKPAEGEALSSLAERYRQRVAETAAISLGGRAGPT
jgi:hypothetical protein